MADVPVIAGTGDGYRRHRPEQTLLYKLVERHYPEFVKLMRLKGRPLPTFVQREFDAFLKCGRLEYGFLRVRCAACRAEKLVAFSCKGRGFCPSCGARRMVDSAALLIDKVLPHRPIRQWVLSVPFALRFLFARQPEALSAALGIVIRAISAHLIARARLTRPQASTGAVTLVQRFGGALNLNIHFHMLVLDGVYVHRPGGDVRFVAIPAPTASEYVARSAIADSRLSLTGQGEVRYALKTPWRDGTTHVLFEPLDFIARLAALIPRPGVNLTRYHGVLAPNSHCRAQVTPARRGKRPAGETTATAPEKHRAMTWERRLKRVFRIDVEVCEPCGGAVKIPALAHPCARGIRASMHIIVTGALGPNLTRGTILYLLAAFGLAVRG